MKNDLLARDVYLELLQKRVNSFRQGYRQNIALIGDELVGKTCIIFRFLDRFCDPRVVTVYIEGRSESF
jgi:GTPase SAR1 family protein